MNANKTEYTLRDKIFIGMVILSLIISGILMLGFTIGLPIYLAVTYSWWWLLLMIVTIPIGLCSLVVFANRKDGRHDVD